MFRRLMLPMLVGVFVCLQTFAYASPADPTWIGGFWDNDDYDDTIVYLMSFGAAETAPLGALQPHWTPVWIGLPDDERVDPSAPVLPHPPRGPPLA